MPLLALQRVGQERLLQQFYQALTIGTLPVTRCQDNIKSLEIVFEVIQAAESWK